MNFFPFHTMCNAQTVKHYGVEDGLLNNQVRLLVSLPNHQIFAATEGAFFLFNGNRFVEQPCRQDSIMQLPEFGRHDYMWQGDSLLWLKDFYHTYIYDVRIQRFRYDYASRLKQQDVKSFLERKDVSNANMLNAYRDTLRLLGAEQSDKSLRAFCKDWQGGEWYGLESDGILYRRPSAPIAHTLVPMSASNPSSGLKDIRHIYALDKDHLLLSGSKGVLLYDVQKDLASPLPCPEAECTSMYKDDKGGIWMSAMQGLYYYKDGSLQFLSTGNTTGFKHSHMRFAIPLPDNRLLVCNLLNLLGYLDLETMHFDCLNDRLPELDKYRVMIDAVPYDNKGTWLVITQNGMFLLDTHTDKISEMLETESVSQFTSKYNCVLHDSQGCIWLGTQNGLFWLVPKLSDHGVVEGYILHRTTTADGLSNNCIRSIIEDTQGNIWVATSYGINALKVKDDSLRIVPLLTADGVPGVEMAERGVCQTPDGHLVFASSKGLTVISSRDLKECSTTFPPRQIAIKVRGENMVLSQTEYQLAYNDFPLEIEVSTLNYSSPEHTLYRYRMCGLTDKWQTDMKRNGLMSTTFNILQPGDYRFEVQARLDNGEWGPTSALNIMVAPPWWLTWWAIAFYVIVSMSLCALALSHYLRYRKRQLEHENEARINKFFELQSEAKHNFAQNILTDTDKLEAKDAQPELAERMNRCIADNMDNVDYTVDSLARDLNMSRASLYKKAQEELGITPNDFMRNVRLKHAITLLEQGIPVNQVALMVGFQTPYYFSKCFKKMFGVNPSQFNKNEPAV